MAVDVDNRPVYEGEVRVTPVSPFEIFPDRLDAEDLDSVGSLIHAQAVSTDYVFERFGVAVKGENLSGLFAFSEPSASRLPTAMTGINTTKLQDGVVLLERYTKPTTENKEGKLET